MYTKSNVTYHTVWSVPGLHLLSYVYPGVQVANTNNKACLHALWAVKCVFLKTISRRATRHEGRPDSRPVTLSAGDWSEEDNTGFRTARLSISSPLSVGPLLFDGVRDTLQ
jgi:hypothetical protein